MAPDSSTRPSRPPARGRGTPADTAPPRARAAAIRRRLLRWWDAGHRDLPWRSPPGAADPYLVWISEVMLQQTQAAAVVPYYRRFVERFPTLAALAGASEDEVLALWSGLGYYARGRRLHRAAREALAHHGGLPASPAALAALPGFGPYTVGAVASIAFGARAACVDGNAARVLARLELVEGPPEVAAVRRRLWALAAALVPPDRPGDFNQALMELGATVCRKPAPACTRCPLEAQCRARRAGRERAVPPARRRPVPRPLWVACAVVRRGETCLVARRPPGGLFGGLWELPSAPVPPGADPRAALRSELRRTLGISVRAGEELASVERSLTHRRLRLTAYRCSAPRLPAGSPSCRLARPSSLVAGACSTAMRLLVEALASFEEKPLTRQGATV